MLKQSDWWDVYLTGPSFNPVQVNWLTRIERLLLQQEVKFLSPRLRMTAHPGSSTKEREKIFRDNMIGVANSRLVIAVMDFLLPPGIELGTICTADTKTKEGFHSGIEFIPVTQPDLGTVWEIGYAKGRSISCVGVWESPTPGKEINLMLANGMQGQLFGLDSLEKFLKPHPHAWDWDEAKVWEGEIV